MFVGEMLMLYETASPSDDCTMFLGAAIVKRAIGLDSRVSFSYSSFLGSEGMCQSSLGLSQKDPTVATVGLLAAL